MIECTFSEGFCYNGHAFTCHGYDSSSFMQAVLIPGVPFMLFVRYQVRNRSSNQIIISADSFFDVIGTIWFMALSGDALSGHIDSLHTS